MRKIRQTYCFCLCIIATLTIGGKAQGPHAGSEKKESVYSESPLKVGLVLSGGGARGLAHIGVLEWFEENQIPVDYVAGTSMGGLIGALYAIGTPPREMRPFVKSLNWDELLSSGPAFEQLAFRRKQDRRDFQVGLELGYRKGLGLPLGASTDHYIGLLIDRITLPYSQIKNFDELPIPFRCVATDFLEARSLVLKDGPLASAMRATMSIPGVFPPVERDGTILVDGALLNNIPTDVMRQLNPDVVIAVDVGSKLGGMESIKSLAGILTQSVSVMTIEYDRQNLRRADIIIAPELGELSLLDFTAIDKTADLGYQAAQSKAAILRRFALDDEQWERHLADRRSRIRHAVPTPQSLNITGVDPEAQKALQKSLVSHIGHKVDPERLENDLTRLTGQGRYSSLGYRVSPDPLSPEQYSLEILIEEKPHSPPTINLGVEIDGSEINEINFTLGGRITFYDIGWYGTEWRNDIKIGFGNRFASEFFKPLGWKGFFVAPRAAYRRERQNIYTGTTRIAEYQADRYGIGFDLGYLMRRGELRFGYELSHLVAKSEIGLQAFPEVGGNIRLARIRYTFDGQDSYTIPSRGLLFTAEGRWYFNAPNATTDFQQLEIHGSGFKPVTRKGSIFGALSAGTSFNDHSPALQQFLIGGPFRFGALDRDVLRTDHYFIATIGYLHSLYELPSLIGGRINAGAWFDQTGTFGGFTAIFDSQRYRAGLSAGLIMDTKVGPFSIVGSYAEGGRGKIYFSIGKFF